MLIIDRFEGDFAVIETDNGMIDIPIYDIPKGAKEGDILVFIINSSEISSRKERINNMMNNLFKD